MKIRTLHSAYSAINHLLYKSFLPKIINAAIELEVFDLVSKQPKTCKEICQSLNTNENVTEAFLDALESIDLLQRVDGKYEAAALSKDFLTQCSEANQIDDVRSFSGSSDRFDNLVEGLRNGSAKFKHDMWSTEKAVLGMEQMAKAGSLQSIVSYVTSIPQFKNCRKMCDFAGNIGYYSAALLNENPNLLAHIFDLPEVCKLAKQLKSQDPNFNRMHFHDFDIAADASFGKEYDLFFISHFLYEYGANQTLTNFFKSVNRAMVLGGVFVSNHISSETLNNDHKITLSLVELQTRLMGYPTHQLPEHVLTTALIEAGFSEFNKQKPNENIAYSPLILSAIKIKNV